MGGHNIMAAFEKKLVAKIISIERTLKSGVDYKITVEFNDDSGKDPWQQSWELIADHPITMEEFMVQLLSSKIERPLSPVRFLEQNIDKPFDLKFQ